MVVFIMKIINNVVMILLMALNISVINTKKIKLNIIFQLIIKFLEEKLCLKMAIYLIMKNGLLIFLLIPVIWLLKIFQRQLNHV